MCLMYLYSSCLYSSSGDKSIMLFGVLFECGRTRGLERNCWTSLFVGCMVHCMLLHDHHHTILQYTVYNNRHVWSILLSEPNMNLGLQALWSSRHLPSRQSLWPVQRSCGNQAWYSIGKTHKVPTKDCDNLSIVCMIYDNGSVSITYVTYIICL